MFRSLKLGKLFGIPVYIHPTFLLLQLWVLVSNWGAGLAEQVFWQLLLVAVFGCVVLHEFGHALTARRFGIRTLDVTLYPIGGVARLEGMSERPLRELAIALAGPAVNVVIALLLTPFALQAVLGGGLADDALSGRTPSVAGKFALMLWWSNVWLVLFNLIPAFPMDGGRVFRALLASVLGHLRATEIAAGVGLVTAGLLAVVPYLLAPVLNFRPSPMLLLVALFVAYAGRQELTAVRWRAARRRTAPEGDVPPDDAAPRPAPPAGFSGVLWDGRYGVWVQWHHGRPVASWGQVE